MTLCLNLVQQIFSLFFMALAGYLLARSGVIKGDNCRSLSLVSIYLLVPAMLLNGFLIEWDAEKRLGMVFAFGAAIILHIMFFAVTALLRRWITLSEVDAASVIYTNAGNVIIPLVLGTLGREYIFYSAAYLTVQNVLMWSFTAPRIGGVKQPQFKRVIKTPAIAAILCGVLFMITPLHLPAVVTEAIESIGNCLGPISMILVGILFAGIDLRKGRKMPGVWCVIMLKLFAYPLIATVVLAGLSRLIKLADIWNILYVVLLAGCGPSAALVVQAAQMYGKDADRSSYINIMTTLLCALTFPLFTLLAQLLFK